MTRFNIPAAVGLAVLVAGTCASARAGTIYAGWNFENDTAANNSSPAASTGTGTAGSVGMNTYGVIDSGSSTDDVTQGKSSDTGANGLANTTNTWRVRGENSGANGWSSAAPIGSQGAQFAASTVNTAGYNAVVVSFDWYATTQGEANLQLQYTTNGTTWQNVGLSFNTATDAGLVALTNNGADTNTVTGAYVSDNLATNGSKAGQDWFTGLTATITDPNAVDDANFAVRMVNASTGTDDVSTQGTALNNTSGNWRFDNVSISGATALVPVPLPPGAPLLLSGLAGLAALVRRRKRA